MVIQSIASSYTSPTPAKTTGNSAMSKDDFLKLMVAQLQQQDPLNPSDPTQFTAQLAQFSSLEQLINVNGNLSGISSQDALSSRVSAAGLIGKTVQVSGSNLDVASGKAGKITYDLAAASTKTSINVYDTNGKLVDVVDLGEQSTGTHDFQWDAKSTNGSTASDGTYRFEIIGQDASGKGVSATTNLSGKVTGVSFGSDGQTQLSVGGSSYKLSDILSVNG